MGIIDITILVIIGFFCVKGFFRGIFIEVLTLGGLLVGYIIAMREMSTISNFLGKTFGISPLVRTSISFIVILIAVVVVFRVIAGILRRFARWAFIGWLDKGGGILFGLIKGTFIASLLMLLISFIPTEAFEQQRNHSFLYKPVRSVSPAVFNFLMRVAPKTKDFYTELREGFDKKKEDISDQIISKQLENLQEELKEHVQED